MKTVCIIHHIEPEWSSAFNKEILLDRVIEHFEHNSYDRVIATTLEGDSPYQYEIGHCYDVVEQWLYGWENPDDEPEWYEDNDINPEDIIPASGHEFTYLYDWIKDLKGCYVYLMGGHRNECLADLIDSLEYLEIDYEIVEECVYG